MKKILAVAVACIALGAGAVPAGASSPAGGTITKARRSVAWSGATFILSDPAPDPITGDLYTPSCHTDPMCDHFALKINLGDNAAVDIRETTARPNPPGMFAGIESLQPVTGDDYDLYVYDPSGKLVGVANDEKGNQHVTITHRKKFNGKAYDVAVRAWAVAPGSTYHGTARALTIGR